MSNSDESSHPGAQPTDDIEVLIHDDCPNQETTTKKCQDCPKCFLKLLREKCVPTTAEAKLKKEEAANAYKGLVDSLESVPDEYSKPTNVVKVTIHGVLPAAFVTVVVAARSVPEVHAKWFLHLRIHRWVALMMVVISGLPCIRLLTLVVSEPMAWFRKTDKYVLYYVRGIKRSVDVTLWFLLVLGVWYTWFRPDVVKDTRGAKTLGIPVPQYEEALKVATKQVTRLLLALTLGAFLWTLKRILYLNLRAKLRYKELCQMIRKTILEFHAIQFITHKNGIKWSFLEDEEPSNQDTTAFLKNISTLRKGSTPIWILKNLCFKYKEHMKTKMPEILSGLDPTYDDDKFQVKANELYDLYKTFLDNKSNTIANTESVFKLLGQQKMNDRDQFVRWAVRALKGCLTLDRILTSSHRIFMKLNMLMSSFVVALVIVIWLLISEMVTTAQLAILFAPLVSASFVFGESLKRTFDGLIFVFGMHPFDVDQRVIVDNVKMKVSELRLLTTVFFEYETGDEIIYPNSCLATKSITKLDLTENTPDSVEFTVPIDTPEELISDLGIKIKKSLDDKVAFTSDTTVSKKSISETNVTLIVHFKYSVAYHSAAIKTHHRSKILKTILRFCEEMKRVKKKENRILQGCEGSKDCSRVLSSGSNEEKITIGANDRDEDSEEVYDILRFWINANVKLFKIEERKKIVMSIIRDYDPQLKGCSHALFIELNKEKITMDVRIRHPKGRLTTEQKKEIEKRIDNTMTEKDVEQRREKQYDMRWILEPDWDDDDC